MNGIGRLLVNPLLQTRVSDADIAAVFDAIKGLQATIGGILAITTGRDMSPEGLQKGFTHGFTVDFNDAATRDA